MHYTVNDGNLYSIAQPHNTEQHVLQSLNAVDPSTQAFQYNMNPNVPAGFAPPKGSEFSPRVAHKRTERDEPLEEGLVMHIREAFLPFNDPSPNTRASKRYEYAILSHITLHSHKCKPMYSQNV
jgi:hypothetical protein